MLSLIRNIYCRLPVVREALALEGQVAALRNRVSDVLRLKQEQYNATLLEKPLYHQPGRLQLSERKVFSQNGEDGVIEEILGRIGNTANTFIEIGIGDGIENNSLYLLHKGWNGVWIDANAEAIRNARQQLQPLIDRYQLSVVEAMVTGENIGDLLTEAGASLSPTVLSIDIDYNTYWIWKSLAHIRAAMVVIEYNATFPPPVVWRADYDPSRMWDGTAHFGASLKAFELLGRELGYALVACESTGVNAFFVRNDLVGEHFCRPLTAENHYEPPRYFMRRTGGHPPVFATLTSQTVTENHRALSDTSIAKNAG